MNRRGVLQGLLAGAALATGLARTRLELVDDTADDVVFFDDPERAVYYFVGSDGLYAVTHEAVAEGRGAVRVNEPFAEQLIDNVNRGTV